MREGTRRVVDTRGI